MKLPTDIRLPTANRAGLLRSMSMATLASAVGGGACLLARSRYQSRLQAQWSTVLLVVGGVLLLYAVVQTLLRVIHGHRTSGLGREVVLLPREGMVFLGIMLVLAAGALIGRSNLLMLVFALMAGTFVLNGVIVSAMLKRIKVARQVPDRAMVGQALTIQVDVENKKRFLSSRLLAVHDRISNEREELDPGVLFVCIPPNSKRRGSYNVRLMQRGEYQLGPLYVASRFPFGLSERGRAAISTGKILVHPRVGTLTQRWLQRVQRGSELVEQRRGRKGIFDDEFHRMREYRSGDNPRAIHWRTSARRNELMVREFEQNRDQNLCVIFDLHKANQFLGATDEETELAISFVATVCCQHVRKTADSRIGLFVGGEQVQSVDAASSHAVLEAMLDALAKVKPSSGDHVDQLLRESAPLRATDARTILVTTRPGFVEQRIAAIMQDADRHRDLIPETLRFLSVVPATKDNLLTVFSPAGASEMQVASNSDAAGRVNALANSDQKELV